MLAEIQKKCFDYKIQVKDPVKESSYSDLWKVEVEAIVTPNENFKIYKSALAEGIRAIAMSYNEILNYKKIGKEIYSVKVSTDKNEEIYYVIDGIEKVGYWSDYDLTFRNYETVEAIRSSILNLTKPIFAFKISNGLNQNYKDIIDINEIGADKIRFNIVNNLGLIRDDLINGFCRENLSNIYGGHYRNCNSNNSQWSSNKILDLYLKNSESASVVFEYNDILTLEEIKRITVYKITPNN